MRCRSPELIEYGPELIEYGPGAYSPAVGATRSRPRTPVAPIRTRLTPSARAHGLEVSGRGAARDVRGSCVRPGLRQELGLARRRKTVSRWEPPPPTCSKDFPDLLKSPRLRESKVTERYRRQKWFLFDLLPRYFQTGWNRPINGRCLNGHLWSGHLQIGPCQVATLAPFCAGWPQTAPARVAGWLGELSARGDTSLHPRSAAWLRGSPEPAFGTQKRAKLEDSLPNPNFFHTTGETAKYRGQAQGPRGLGDFFCSQNRMR